MKNLTLKTVISSERIARVYINEGEDAFYRQGKTWEAIKTIFDHLGIKLIPGQEEHIRSCFDFTENIKRRHARVKDINGNEYMLLLLNDMLLIKLIVIDYIVEDI